MMFGDAEMASAIVPWKALILEMSLAERALFSLLKIYQKAASLVGVDNRTAFKKIE